MCKVIRTNNYPTYTDDSDSDDYYNEDERVVYSYPPQKRIIRIVPIRKFPENGDIIYKRYNTSAREEPERERIMYPSTRLVRRVNVETGSSSSDYDRDNPHFKVHAFRPKIRDERIDKSLNLYRRKEFEIKSYVSPSLITRVKSRSGCETKSSNDDSDSKHTKVREKRFTRRKERFQNSSPRDDSTHQIIGESSDSKAKRNEVSEKVISSKEHTVYMVSNRHNHHIKKRKDRFSRIGVHGGHQQRNNVTHQTKLTISKNTGLTFIRPYNEVCGNNGVIETKETSSDNHQSYSNLIKRKESLESDSYTSFSDSSESDKSEGNTTDSSKSQQHDKNKIKFSRSNQTHCVLVDYSKLLKYRDGIVKPLPRNTKMKNTLEETYNIKETLRIDSEMRKIAERRSQLEVWT
ncbi:peptidyl-prolyl cis-trans isomerase G-like [Mytilus edulis]|uniref:peptidyl-prolyl cis-trans isomerase G-like n=1 Tax=Mytilus edulis TaxID=6550 RepID=UPI0039F07ADE